MPGSHPPSPDWRLAFEDGFDRTDVGPGWLLLSGKAEVADGRLRLTGAGATILIDRPFADDVRLEFEAEADPAAPPCDLSATLAASPFWGWEYLLGFGANSNRQTHILGAGPARVDRESGLLIEPGRRYRIAARREGARLSLEVDGRTLVEAVDPDPAGGLGFDRAGLVTWSGMLVDRVRVWERTEPAPGGPAVLRSMPDLGFRRTGRALRFEGAAPPWLAAGLEALDARRGEEAWRIFSAVDPPTLPSVAALAYALGDLGRDERPGDAALVARLAVIVSRNAPGDRRAADFALAAGWFSRLTIESRDRRAATRLVAPGPGNNPFYYKADLYRGRYQHAAGAEGADPRRLAEALEIFQRLRDLWPEVPALRELAGERVPWRPDLIRGDAEGPPWARLLEECLRRQAAILDWWFERRQAPDGQLGGGWGDDVELLRTWAPVAAISTAAEPAVAGIERLAEGVWNGVLDEGYPPGPGDVEHEAEPGGDTLPPMMLLRHGDPHWIERNLRAARTIRERFLAVNRRGRLQFRSAEFGAREVLEDARAGGDTGYHARAMRHFLWLGWSGIPEARETYLAWCETWREATAERIGTKPPFFPPASIFFPEGTIDPPGGRPWHDPAAHYYGFPGLPLMTIDALLSAAWLSGERRFLEAVAGVLDRAAGPLVEADPNLPGDHPRNLQARAVHLAPADALAVHRLLSGERVHDRLLLARGSAVQRYQVDGDLVRLETGLAGVADGLRHGWALRTSEVLQTDRAALPGAAETFEAYTGAVRDFRDCGAPAFAVTWDSPDLAFAALVAEAGPARLRVRLFRFGAAPARLGLRRWALAPGRYALLAGEAAAGERPGLERCLWSEEREVVHLRRAESIPIDVPPGKEWMVDLRLREAIARPALLPDLAVGRGDIRQEPGRIAVKVHNVGGAPAGRFAVAVEIRQGGEAITAGRTEVDGLPAVRGLEPSAREVIVEAPVPAGLEWRVVVDPDGAVEESCESNNDQEPDR